MKKTALYNKHIKLGAKMVPFAGYEMPVQYKGVNTEHINVRNNVGAFDVSHMGEIIVSGENALSLIQKISSNDASLLFPGRAQYSYMPNHNGGVVDDLIIYMLEENRYMLVVNASNIEKDWNWLNQHNDVGAKLENLSDNISLIALQGPNSMKLLQNITDTDLEEIKFYHFKNGNVAGIENVIISATGYTGSGGFELYVNNENAEKLWDSIFSVGQSYNISPAGLAARDTLRLEMGYCLYGNDINDQTSPISAGLGWVTKFSKSFINDHQLKYQKENGVGKKLVAFKLLERGIPRKDYIIEDENNSEIGIVTSGTMGPSVKFSIGLGYVKTQFAALGTKIFVRIRQKSLQAEIVKLPFYKP
tara:strand:+ start:4150 stop:5232 length:1083 start_codon:yes stop_codon:yes gene_type:complete